MAVNYVWHVVWGYVDVNGKPLGTELSADYILAVAPAGPDGTTRPLITDLLAKIASNFATPPGGTITLRLISSGQCAAVYS